MKYFPENTYASFIVFQKEQGSGDLTSSPSKTTHQVHELKWRTYPGWLGFCFCKMLPLLRVRRMNFYTMDSSVCMPSTINIFIKQFGSLGSQSQWMAPNHSEQISLVSSLLLSYPINSFRIMSKRLSLKCPFMIWPHLLTFLYLLIFHISLCFNRNN